MPTYPIQLKRSGTASATPSSLVHGELAINYNVADGKLFWKDSSNVIQSFTFQAYALSSHTHAASDITSGTLDAARLPLATTIAAGSVIVGTGLGVSSGTVSVTYGTSAGTACQGNDSRLSDARTPTSHSHGNITNAGAIGSTANLPIITTTSGVLTTGSFGTSAATFCEGNDSRLSDTRTPTDGSVTTAKIANDAVTYAKLQNVSATDRLLGRSSAGSGDVEEITCTAFGRSLIDDADAAAARSTLSVQPTASPAFTGAATFTVSSGSSVPVSIANSGTGNSLVVATNFIVDGSGRLGLFGAPRSFEACSVLGTAPSSSQASLGFRVQCTYPSSTTADAASFSSFPTTQAASYTLTNLYHFAAFQQAFGAGSTVTNQYGLFVDSTLTGATNNYAVYTGIASGTGRWAIYAAGTAASYFGGQVQISAGSGSSGSYKPGVAVSGDDDTGLQQVGGANTISLVTAGSERVRVDASGNVGIGGAPFYALDVQRTSANAILNVQTTTSGNAQLRIECAGNASSTITQNRTSNNLEITNGSSGSIVFTNNGSERVRVGSGGGVGIGTATTTDALNVVGITSHYQSANGTPALGSKQYYSACFENFSAGYGLALGGVQGGNGAAYLQVQSFSSAVAYPMYLQALGGEVLIGTTTDSGAYLLQVNSQIYATNATIATSDARFKTNVEPLTDATSVIEALRPVAFDFIPHEERNFATERQVGLIAQEAQSALAGTDYADSVVAQCGDHLGLAYEKLVPVLIRALQESNARIAALEERNHA